MANNQTSPYIADATRTQSVDGLKRSGRNSKDPRNGSGLIIIIVVLLAIIAGGAWFIYSEKNDGVVPINTSDFVIENDEVRDIVERVGELINLPEGEEPTIATVTDPEQLRDQPFFANAKAGDKVLMYTQARKVYLYDPTVHKLVEVAPISIDPL